MTERTDAPWRLLEPDQVRGSEGQFVADCHCNQVRNKTDRCNAEFIVRACNCHDALLAVCKKAEAALRSFAATSDDPAAALIAQSPEAGALDLAEELAEVIGKAGGAMNANLPPADYYLAKAHGALQDAVPLLSACQWDNNPETHALYQLGRAVEYLTKAVEHMRQAEIGKEEER